MPKITRPQTAPNYAANAALDYALASRIAPSAAPGTDAPDLVTLVIDQDEPVQSNLRDGYDVVSVEATTVDQVRLTFTSAEVGNGSARDSGTLANQDGKLAVRVQAEDMNGELTGGVSRFDDEGISFVARGAFTFDVRDLVSGVARGDGFKVVRLGTTDGDVYDESGTRGSFYINGGAGADDITTGRGQDFLVGGAGDDRLFSAVGGDSFLGGAGNDVILGGNGADTAIQNLSTDGADRTVLGGGSDTVRLTVAAGVSQVRVTFTSAEVGNGSINDAGTGANQDGGFAVRIATEDSLGGIAGEASRYDDEGIAFFLTGGVTFDVRDLVSGTERGDGFEIVWMGAERGDRLNATDQLIAVYANGGAGRDRYTGGLVDDFLVGGVGDDVLNGWDGDDQMLGGAGADKFVFYNNAGNDTILDFVSGTDTIGLKTFDVRFSDLTIEQMEGGTLVSVDTNDDSAADFTIMLAGVTEVARGDFVF